MIIAAISPHDISKKKSFFTNRKSPLTFWDAHGLDPLLHYSHSEDLISGLKALLEGAFNIITATR